MFFVLTVRSAPTSNAEFQLLQKYFIYINLYNVFYFTYYKLLLILKSSKRS